MTLCCADVGTTGPKEEVPITVDVACTSVGVASLPLDSTVEVVGKTPTVGCVVVGFPACEVCPTTSLVVEETISDGAELLATSCVVAVGCTEGF